MLNHDQPTAPVLDEHADEYMNIRSSRLAAAYITCRSGRHRARIAACSARLDGTPVGQPQASIAAGRRAFIG